VFSSAGISWRWRVARGRIECGSGSGRTLGRFVGSEVWQMGASVEVEGAGMGWRPERGCSACLGALDEAAEC
jgi:hypothetical protein